MLNSGVVLYNVLQFRGVYPLKIETIEIDDFPAGKRFSFIRLPVSPISPEFKVNVWCPNSIFPKVFFVCLSWLRPTWPPPNYPEPKIP